MSVLEEGALDDEKTEEPSPKPKSLTALSILESLAGQADEDAADVPADVPSEDAQSVESLGHSSGERLPIDDDVFELEGLEVS